jgi:coronin-1B/1C/6
LQQEKITRIKCDHPIVSGHKGPILDLAWSLHNQNLIATGSEDCSVKIWLIPDEGLTKTITEPLLALLYHQRRVGIILWHPTAENVLLSAGIIKFHHLFRILLSYLFKTKKINLYHSNRF